jgi:hypothetical protein
VKYNDLLSLGETNEHIISRNVVVVNNKA